MPHTVEDKLQWEVEKLRAETRNLSRPFLRQPAFWIGLGGLTLSLSTNLLQLNSAERNRQLAEIRTVSLQVDAKRLETQKAELDTGVREQRAYLNQVAKELEEQKSVLEKLKTEVLTTGSNRESLLQSINELQQRAGALGTIAESASRSLAQAGSPMRQLSNRDIEKAAQLELRAYEALVARDFVNAQRLFQASEDSANGFRYSYEWSRLLRTRASELSTPEGQRQVLQFALSKGYANYAPEGLRTELRKHAQ